MTIHCIHLFDRRGKTLFTKTYSSVAAQQQIQSGLSPSPEYGDSSPVEEQRKLVFGMLYSLGELIGKLTPDDETASLQSVETGAATVHNYETISGLRFALYTSIDVPNSKKSSTTTTPATPKHSSSDDKKRYVHDTLRHIFSEIWVECVVRSPMYKPGLILAVGERQSTKVGEEKFDIATTNFEKQLDQYLTSLSWFR